MIRLLFCVFFLFFSVVAYSQCPNAIFSAPNTDITRIDASGCNTQDGSIVINSINLIGKPPFSFLLGSQPVAGNTLVLLAPGQYTVYAIDANKCMDSIKVTIQDLSGINSVTVASPPAQINCNTATGNIVIGTPSPNTAGPFKFSLNNGTPQSSAVFSGLGPGAYEPAIFYGAVFACKFNLPTVFIVNKTTTSSGCYAGDDVTIFEGESAFINGFADGGAVDWEPGDEFDDSTSASPFVRPDLTGIHTYTMHTYNASNCTLCSDEVVITVIPEIDPPNTFTPNGDNINDVWEIANLNRFDDCELWIYTRWGERVLHQNGYEEGQQWNGTNNGLRLAPATYYYVIDIKKKDSEGRPKKYAGAVNIVK